MALEGITRKDLDEYLNGGLGEINEAINEAIDVKEAQRPLEGPWGPDKAPGDVNLDDIF